MTKVETHGSINNQIEENKEDKEDKNDKEDGGILITIIFYLFGMGTLIGTNSVLNQYSEMILATSHNQQEIFASSYPKPVLTFVQE